MTASTQSRLPLHLRKYIVDQDYQRYTPEDQSVWRFIMRQLKDFLGKYAHSSYLDGLKRTGITIDRIPSIKEVDEHLEKFGWGAVAVSGFIPPAAFMEFQSLGILPIASDMRSIDHLLYTPAPDIVHEAAGHAPILANPDYAAYLRQYGEIARRAIISREDLDQYEAIRVLSDVKENPESTPADIAAAEKRLNDVNERISFISEAALLSRMNWWTAEYGLIGEPSGPSIFGAGLLSSVGESRFCLSEKVKKIPLTVECINYSYDITEPQPQLFVTRDFAQLGDVLEQMTEQLSYKRGGEFGLKRAIEAETVNTVQLDSGIQISGRLRNYINDSHGRSIYLQFEGPSQLALDGREIPGQGLARHAHGYSCPVGSLKNTSYSELFQMKGRSVEFEFESGVRVKGNLLQTLTHHGKPVLMTLKDCKVMLGDQILFDPSWGEYDMAIGSSVPSVFGGPADRETYKETEDFGAQFVPQRRYTSEQLGRHALFAEIRDLRERPRTRELSQTLFRELSGRFLKMSRNEWLPGMELLEVSYQLELDQADRAPLLERLRPENFAIESVRMAVSDGLLLANKTV